MSRSLVVKCTVGPEENIERFAQAMTVAAGAVAAGVPVSVWLTGEAVWLAVPGNAEQMRRLPHSADFADLRDTIVAGGGTFTVCTQCAARRQIVETELIAGVRIKGSASFVEEVLADGVQALVY